MSDPEKPKPPAPIENESSELKGIEALELYIMSIRQNFADIDSQFDKLNSIIKARQQTTADLKGESQVEIENTGPAIPDDKP